MIDIDIQDICGNRYDFAPNFGIVTQFYSFWFLADVSDVRGAIFVLVTIVALYISLALLHVALCTAVFIVVKLWERLAGVTLCIDLMYFCAITHFPDFEMTVLYAILPTFTFCCGVLVFTGLQLSAADTAAERSSYPPAGLIGGGVGAFSLFVLPFVAYIVYTHCKILLFERRLIYGPSNVLRFPRTLAFLLGVTLSRYHWFDAAAVGSVNRYSFVFVKFRGNPVGLERFPTRASLVAKKEHTLREMLSVPAGAACSAAAPPQKRKQRAFANGVTWFVLIELLRAIVPSLVIAYPVSSAQGCALQISITASLVLLYSFAVFLVRPYCLPIVNFAIGVSHLLLCGAIALAIPVTLWKVTNASTPTSTAPTSTYSFNNASGDFRPSELSSSAIYNWVYWILVTLSLLFSLVAAIVLVLDALLAAVFGLDAPHLTDGRHFEASWLLEGRRVYGAAVAAVWAAVPCRRLVQRQAGVHGLGFWPRSLCIPFATGPEDDAASHHHGPSAISSPL